MSNVIPDKIVHLESWSANLLQVLNGSIGTPNVLSVRSGCIYACPPVRGIVCRVPYAVDPETADRLWSLSEQLTFVGEQRS